MKNWLIIMQYKLANGTVRRGEAWAEANSMSEIDDEDVFNQLEKQGIKPVGDEEGTAVQLDVSVQLRE